MSYLPLEMVNKIVMMNRPTFVYMEKLKEAFFFIRDFAEDFDNDFSTGLAYWNRENRERWNEPNLTTADTLELIGECCILSMYGECCDCE